MCTLQVDIMICLKVIAYSLLCIYILYTVYYTLSVSPLLVHVNKESAQKCDMPSAERFRVVYIETIFQNLGEFFSLSDTLLKSQKPKLQLFMQHIFLV